MGRRPGRLRRPRDHDRRRDQPVLVDTGPGTRLALSGSPSWTEAVARSIERQLQSELRPEQWEKLSTLLRLRTDDDGAAMASELREAGADIVLPDLSDAAEVVKAVVALTSPVDSPVDSRGI